MKAQTVQARKERRAEYAAYLASPEWQRVRDAFFALHPRACCVCGVTRKLQLHHKTYRHIYDELAHLDDLECRCATHHLEAHSLPKRRRQRQVRRSRHLAKKLFSGLSQADYVRMAACSKCGAGMGEACTSQRGGAHPARVKAVRRLVRYPRSEAEQRRDAVIQRIVEQGLVQA